MSKSKRFFPHPEDLPRELTVPTLLPTDLKDSKLLESLGVTKEYVLNEYMKVVNQDDDLSNKLKALKPLAKEIGIDLDGTNPFGITNNIIVMPGEIVRKHTLSTDIIVGDTPPSTDTIEAEVITPKT